MDEKLRMINFLGQYLASSRMEKQILDMALMTSQYVMGYDHAIIRILKDDLLVTKTSVGFPRESEDLPIRIGEGISGAVAKTGKPVLSEDTQSDNRFLQGVEGCRSELCVPLIYNNKTIGVINVESSKKSFFSMLDQRLLETLASQVAGAIENARLREELMQSEKLSVVGMMASSIMHDIRNDIHQLNISSSLLRRKDLNPERIAKISDMVKSSGENIYELISNIFEFVKTGEPALKKKSELLKSLLESVKTEAKSKAPKGVKVRLKADENLKLKMDRRKFHRLIINLVNNAIEAMPSGGELSISAYKEDGRAVIVIKDTGVGISPENIEKIWEPLYTHGKATGTGLGMAIVKKIVDNHGWSVEVESTLGEGTAFTIRAN